MSAVDLGRWTLETETILRASGWFPGRSVRDQVERWKLELREAYGLTMFEAAENVLLEFGGLDVRSDGSGRNCGRSSFEVDPIAPDPASEELMRLAGQDLFPIGAVNVAELYVGRDGTGYLSFRPSWFSELAPSFRGSVEALVLGIRGRALMGE